MMRRNLIIGSTLFCLINIHRSQKATLKKIEVEGLKKENTI